MPAEVHVGGILGPLGPTPPLPDEHGRPAEGRGVAARAFEFGTLDRSRGETAAVDVRREHDTAVVRERRRHAGLGVGPEGAGLEEHQVREAVRTRFTGAHRCDRGRVQVRQPLQLGPGERVRLVHQVVAGNRVLARELLRDVAEHVCVAGAHADAAGSGRVGPERGERRPHRRAQLADAGGNAPRRARVEGGPPGCAVPPERRIQTGRAHRAGRGRERRAPCVLVEVDDRVDPLARKQVHRVADVRKVPIVVLPRFGLDARPRNEEPYRVPTGARDAARVRGRRAGRSSRTCRTASTRPKR